MAKTPVKKKPVPKKQKWPKVVRLTEADRAHFEALHNRRQQVVANAQVALNEIDDTRRRHADAVAVAYKIDSVDSYVWNNAGKGTRKKG